MHQKPHTESVIWGLNHFKARQTPTMLKAAHVLSQSGHAAQKVVRPLQVLFADRKWHGEDGWLLFRAANPRMERLQRRFRACQSMCRAEGGQDHDGGFCQHPGPELCASGSARCRHSWSARPPHVLPRNIPQPSFTTWQAFAQQGQLQRQFWLPRNGPWLVEVGKELDYEVVDEINERHNKTKPTQCQSDM